MHTEFVAQPDRRVGDLISAGIEQRGTPVRLVLVSAFASLTTVLRMKPLIEAVRVAGGNARVVLGVDLGGTSKEVLQEVAGWDIPVTIVKNKLGGITFHPKIYVVGWPDHAEIFVGSNNLTDGGLYRNSEACSRTSYDLPTDTPLYRQGLEELKRFLKPSGPTSSLLTPAYLVSLLATREIPSEADARRRRGEAMATMPGDNQPTNVFGFEPVPPAPKLPTELQKLLLAARNNQQAEFRSAAAKARKAAIQAAAGGRTKLVPVLQPPPPLAQLDPTYFYMTLPAMQGGNNPSIPGESRIPLEAIDMAEDFWGWPDNYDRAISPRKGEEAAEPRIYRNWRPNWRIFSSSQRENAKIARVRMYFYENSKDFRFYARELIRLGAAAGDIVRLQRVDEPNVTYECVLAKTGSSEHAKWSPLLVNEVRARNSDRRFGFT